MLHSIFIILKGGFKKKKNETNGSRIIFQFCFYLNLECMSIFKPQNCLSQTRKPLKQQYINIYIKKLYLLQDVLIIINTQQINIMLIYETIVAVPPYRFSFFQVHGGTLKFQIIYLSIFPQKIDCYIYIISNSAYNFHHTKML